MENNWYEDHRYCELKMCARNVQAFSSPMPSDPRSFSVITAFDAFHIRSWIQSTTLRLRRSQACRIPAARARCRAFTIIMYIPTTLHEIVQAADYEVVFHVSSYDVRSSKFLANFGHFSISLVRFSDLSYVSGRR